MFKIKARYIFSSKMGKSLLSATDKDIFIQLFNQYTSQKKFTDHERSNEGAACLRVAHDLCTDPANALIVSDSFKRIASGSPRKQSRELLKSVLRRANVNVTCFNRRVITNADTRIFAHAFVKDSSKTEYLTADPKPTVCDILLRIHNKHLLDFSATYLRSFPKKVVPNVGNLRDVGLHFAQRVWPSVADFLISAGHTDVRHLFSIKTDSGKYLNKRRLPTDRKRPCRVDAQWLQTPVTASLPVGCFSGYDEYLRHLVLVRNSAILSRFGSAVEVRLLKNTFSCMVVVGNSGDQVHLIDYVPSVTDLQKVLNKTNYVTLDSKDVFYPYVLNESGKNGEFAFNIRKIDSVKTTSSTKLSFKDLLSLPTVGNGVYVGVTTLSIPGCNGLFADTNFKRRQIITAYSGWSISDPLNLWEMYRHGFLKRVCNDHYVDGLRIPLKGIPGAQFANHAEKNDTSRWNSELVMITVGSSEQVTVIRATRPIVKDEEIFCYYGAGDSLVFEK